MSRSQRHYPLMRKNHRRVEELKLYYQKVIPKMDSEPCPIIIQEMDPAASEIFNVFPDEVLELVLSELDGLFLIKTCRLVCKRWNILIEKPTIWRQKCIRAGMVDPGKVHVPDYKVYFFKLGHNLIKNGWATQQLTFWDKPRNTGAWDERERLEGDMWGFVMEDCFPDAVNSEPLPLAARRESGFHDQEGRFQCWATTYYTCAAVQNIDLLKCGCCLELLDGDNRPDLLVSEWIAARRDCASTYTLRVKLKGDDEKVLDKFSQTVQIQQWSDGSWQKIQHVFSPIPPGTRYVYFRHEGRDLQYWAGSYGTKFTGATVKFIFKPKSSNS